ncbi:hypothetical protein V6N12_007673 [Hibiscus sabdariffa]|uniref:Uncharacterized protein n=1 Tax=Hibiscus sabdariffa TaxID=183260 RepID=A0ABR2F2F8_9ROSI
MRIVLNQERKEYVIIESVPNEPGTNPPRASKDKFEKQMDDMLDVGCLVLATITLELQKQHEYVVSYEMIQNLKEIFEGKACSRAIHPNFIMNEIDETLPQLLGMLRIAGSSLKKNGSNSIQIVRVAKERERKGQSLRVMESPNPKECIEIQRRN